MVLRLRGRTSLGATFLLVMADYARSLGEAGGRLYLSGVDPQLVESFHDSGRINADGPLRIIEATEMLGESTGQAFQDARMWLVSHDGDPGVAGDGRPQAPDGADEPGAAPDRRRATPADRGPAAGRDDEPQTPAET